MARAELGADPYLRRLVPKALDPSPDDLQDLPDSDGGRLWPCPEPERRALLWLARLAGENRR